MVVLKIVGILFICVVLLIAVILALPVDVLFLAGSETKPKLLYRFLGKLFGEKKKPESPISRRLKKVLGIAHLESTDALSEAVAERGTVRTVSESVETVKILVTQLFKLLKHCRVKAFKVLSVSAGEHAAIDYGIVCAAVYPLAGFFVSNGGLKQKHLTLDLGCNYSMEKPRYDIAVTVRVRIFRVLIAFLKILAAQHKKSNTTR